MKILILDAGLTQLRSLLESVRRYGHCSCALRAVPPALAPGPHADVAGERRGHPDLALSWSEYSRKLRIWGPACAALSVQAPREIGVEIYFGTLKCWREISISVQWELGGKAEMGTGCSVHARAGRQGFSNLGVGHRVACPHLLTGTAQAARPRRSALRFPPTLASGPRSLRSRGSGYWPQRMIPASPLGARSGRGRALSVAASVPDSVCATRLPGSFVTSEFHRGPGASAGGAGQAPGGARNSGVTGTRSDRTRPPALLLILCDARPALSIASGAVPPSVRIGDRRFRRLSRSFHPNTRRRC